MVAQFLRATGPGIGIPSLRAAFPDMPRCELADLRREYWRIYRHHNRVAVEKLTWHSPGRVWTMDHAKPPQPIDGLYPSLLSVRDLPSGMVLDWLPVPDETAATMRINRRLRAAGEQVPTVNTLAPPNPSWPLGLSLTHPAELTVGNPCDSPRKNGCVRRGG